jgi:hypothetical protein
MRVRPRNPLFRFVEQEQDFVGLEPLDAKQMAVWKRMNLAAGVGAGG